ncbi:uncharacterized protein LOC6036867 [Culex quinquefasciatus]|uniref:uncharacterized protein LOC6036867 n=1 Tax=Culex quinquefasciatus TaxID=7176 RepID=UPI0018E38951|nr:uncharacterized protein LOC6036867 [Culex quinquefasciatus]
MVSPVLLRGETDNLKLKADYLSSWDLSYLKFCCKAHGIRRELYACQTIAVVSLTDIKRCYPLGTVFEDHFPNKTMYSQLAVKHISQTRPQGNPSPKNVIHQTVRSSVLQPANTTTTKATNQRHQALKPHNENQQATKRPQVNPSPKQAVCNSANEALAVRSHAGQVLQHANTTTMTDNDQQESGQGPSNRVVSVIMLVQSPINPPLQESWLHSVIPLQEQLQNKTWKELDKSPSSVRQRSHLPLPSSSAESPRSRSPVFSPSPVRQRSRLPSPSLSAESPRRMSPVFSPSPVRQRSRLPSPSSSAESPRSR